jgi:hypothetical protein
MVSYIPPFDAGQRLGKHMLTAMNTHSNRRIVGPVSVVPCIPLLFSKVVPAAKKNIVSKERRQSSLHRT